MSKAPYGREAQPPPKLEKGQKVKVTQLSVTKTTGNYGPQYQINGVLEEHENWQARAWVKHYDDPTVNTKMYKIAVLVDKALGQWSPNAEVGILKLPQVGAIYFEVSGFKVDAEKRYPRFFVLDDKLPLAQTKMRSSTDRADKIIEFIANSHDDYSLEDVKALVKDERAKAGGLLTEEAAAYLLCHTLGLDIETSGIHIA